MRPRTGIEAFALIESRRSRLYEVVHGVGGRRGFQVRGVSQCSDEVRAVLRRNLAGTSKGHGFRLALSTNTSQTVTSVLRPLQFP